MVCQRFAFRIQGSGCEVQDPRRRVQGSGFRVQGSGCRVDQRLVAAKPEQARYSRPQASDVALPDFVGKEFRFKKIWQWSLLHSMFFTSNIEEFV